MASYSVAAAEIAAYGKVLVASTVDTVTIDRDCDWARVYNDTGSAAIYFTVDGSTPTVGGQGTYRVPAIVGAWTDAPVRTSGDTVVKVISSGTPTYTAEGSL